MDTPLRDRTATFLVTGVAVMGLAAAPGRPFLPRAGVLLRPIARGARDFEVR